jgi:hypothetical protein
VNAGEVSISGSRQNGISRLVANQHYWFNLDSGGTPQSAVPEPSTYITLAGGLIAMIGLGRWRRS